MKTLKAQISVGGEESHVDMRITKTKIDIFGNEESIAIGIPADGFALPEPVIVSINTKKLFAALASGVCIPL